MSAAISANSSCEASTISMLSVGSSLIWVRTLKAFLSLGSANAMTAVSLAAERLYAEREHGQGWEGARLAAYQAAMIPVINSLFAVGLVSLPGMMTGQILSGVSPLIAARYQIMVMCMIFASAGISTAIFLALVRRYIGSAEAR